MHDNFAENMAGAVIPTIIVFSGEEDALPDFLKEKIQLERIIDLAKNAQTANDWEAMAYLMTASLAAPPSTTWFRIYMHLFNKLMPEKAKEADIGQDVKELQPDEERELNKLKDWIFKKRSEREKERFKKV